VNSLVWLVRQAPRRPQNLSWGELGEDDQALIVKARGCRVGFVQPVVKARVRCPNLSNLRVSLRSAYVTYAK